MLTKLSDIKVLVWDYGNYIEVAMRLSRDFFKVYYYCPYVFNGYPSHAPYDIGRNVPKIERVYEWSEVFDEVDFIYFPDCYDPETQELFRRMGKKVFGSGRGSLLERDRGGMKEIQKEIGLPINKYQSVKGVDNLESYLKTHEDKYIKSSLRGDMETWHHQNYKLSKKEIDRMRSEMGVFDEEEEYIVEAPIESVAEVGYDGFVISGKYPSETCCGIELKDTVYIGKFIKYDELPEQMKLVTDKLAPIFEECDYRGAYSNEIRISKDGKGYLIDQTCRCPQPNTSLAIEMYENYSQIVWNVANGIVPEIKYIHKWGVQLIIKSETAQSQPVPIIVPDKYKKLVKIKNLVIDNDGLWYYTPQGTRMKEIGAFIGMASTMQGAIDMVKDVAENVKGFDISVDVNALNEGVGEIKKLKEAGINFL